MTKVVEKVLHYKAGFEVRTERVDGTESTDFTIRSAYTPDGSYIGDPKMARMLCVKYGIRPELVDGDKVCSVGFSERDQKWYGWSHRAIFGFGIGAVANEGDCCTTSGWTEEYLAEHPEASRAIPVGFVAETLNDARRMAEAFAESVS
mgnify:CR=1 FL=1